MTQSELKQRLEELISTYFTGAVVMWGMTKATRPPRPLVRLTMGTVRGRGRSIRESVNGIPTDCYLCRTTVQVDLYTKGRRPEQEYGVIVAAENTALNDMLAFLSFLNSPYVDDWCEVHDIALSASEVQDLTELINETSWDYRAMIEVEVGFTENVVGYAMLGYEGGRPIHDNGMPKYDDEGYALDDTGERLPSDPLPTDDEEKPIFPSIEPTPSGGGSQDLADQFTGWFEAVESPENKGE